MKKGGCVLDLSKKEIVIGLYNSGKTLREIAKLTSHSQATIMRVLKEAKVKLRGERSSRINRAKLKKLPKDYLELKVSVKELMKKYRIKSEQTFYKILDEFKVPRHRVIVKKT